MNDAAPLSEIRVEEIRARLDAVGDPSFIHQGPAMCFTLDAQQAALFVLAHNAPADIRVLLADRDRLQRRVEELEAEAVATNAIRRRVAALLLAIQHDCHWSTQRGGGAIHQFRAYDAEAAAILAELLPLEQRKEIERLLTSEPKP